MAIKIQVVVMDDRDYILEYKDFKPMQQYELNEYVIKQLGNPTVTKVYIRKWNF